MKWELYLLNYIIYSSISHKHDSMTFELQNCTPVALCHFLIGGSKLTQISINWLMMSKLWCWWGTTRSAGFHSDCVKCLCKHLQSLHHFLLQVSEDTTYIKADRVKSGNLYTQLTDEFMLYVYFLVICMMIQYWLFSSTTSFGLIKCLIWFTWRKLRRLLWHFSHISKTTTMSRGLQWVCQTLHSPSA